MGFKRTFYRNHINYCMLCHKKMESNKGNYHSHCGDLVRQIMRCKPENRPWAIHQLELKHKVKIILTEEWYRLQRGGG